MKVALITDIHFGVRNGSKYFLDNYERYFDQVFFPTLKERGIKHLLIMGDTWEYRTKLDVVAMVRTFRMFFDRLEEMGIQVTMIYGNHDVAYKNTNEYNSIDFLGKMYPNIHVVKETETITFGNLPINFVSWVNNENLERCLEFINTCPPTVLLGHFEIKSFEMIKGHVCEHGFEKSVFDRFDKVYSGHFHTISADGRIMYISNPFQTSWSDYGLEKGARIFDTETLELEFIQNPFEVYAKIAYNDGVDIQAFDYSEFDGKIVRVYVESFVGTNKNKLDLFLERLNRSAYNVETIEVDETVFNDQEKDIEFVNNEQLIDTYIEEIVQNPNLDKAVLKGLFRELYDEAKTMVETE